jgi:hypothetical protein
VRLALEEEGMLPGDPNRIFRRFAGKLADSKNLPQPEENSSSGTGAGEEPGSDAAAVAAITLSGEAHVPKPAQ